MAKFNNANEGVPASQLKLTPTPFPGVASGQVKKVVSPFQKTDFNQGNTTLNTQPKPVFVKPQGSLRLHQEGNNDKDPPFPKLKATQMKSLGQSDETKPLFPKQPINIKNTELVKTDETKPAFLKPSTLKPVSNSNLSEKEPKPNFQKTPSSAKPPWVTESSQNEDSGTKTVPKPKPKVGSFKINKETEEGSPGTDSQVKPYGGITLKPTVKPIGQTIVIEKKEQTETNENKASNPRDAFLAKLNQGASGATTGAALKSPVHKPNVVKKTFGPNLDKENEKNNSSAPKRKTLPHKLAIGNPPTKPNRPPFVNLEQHKTNTSFSSLGSKPGIPKPGPAPPAGAPPTSQPSPAPPLPILPPRHPAAVSEGDENYDDVGVGLPPPLPAGKPGEDEDMYEDLEERWEKENKEQDKKREKEQKKRLEQEKKEQKDREKKENEIRKRFKLVGPIEVIHEAKGKVDCKGGKNELSLKQGERVEIIRVTDNPEGKWLGRTADGSYGYIKTELVEVDYGALKSQQKKPVLPSSRIQAENDPDVYDDVGAQDDVDSSQRGSGVILPPLPNEDDIYHDVDNPELSVSLGSQEDPKSNSWSWGLLKMLKSKDEKKKSLPDINLENVEGNKTPADDEIYDDVESTDFPPPPPESSLPKIKNADKTPDKDPKKQKKFEKEEKEFRKRFKYEGEIKVLHQVTVIPGLNNKKWANKELALKPSEVLDVIQKAVDNKFICRNEEGKCKLIYWKWH
ncbi:FYB1 protein, partial [Polypterus senegalus]|nr:FYB1 protein [Polypterus senegalus]